MGWNYLSIPKLQRLHRWSLGMDKQFHPTVYYVCSYLLGLKLNHVSKRGHRGYSDRKFSPIATYELYLIWTVIFLVTEDDYIRYWIGSWWILKGFQALVNFERFFFGIYSLRRIPHLKGQWCGKYFRITNSSCILLPPHNSYTDDFVAFMYTFYYCPIDKVKWT